MVKMQELKYDIIVVGAGPAGSTAAKIAASAGAKTLLLEKQKSPGLAERCGGISTELLLEPYVDLSSDWIKNRVSRAVLYAPDGTPIEIRSDRDHGLFIDRKLFDRQLAKDAEMSGAELLTSTKATGLLTEGNRVTGLKCQRNGKEQYYKSQVVIGANGFGSSISTWAGIHQRVTRNDTWSAARAIVEDINIDEGAGHFYWGKNIAPFGYAWVVPHGNGKANVGIGVPVSNNKQGTSSNLLKEFVQSRFPNSKIKEITSGGIPMAAPIPSPVGNGIIIAGDAALHCNPINGAGIHTALYAGQQAGQIAAEAVLKNDVSKKELERYSIQVNKEFGNLHRRLYKYRDMVFNQSDEKLNNLAKLFEKIPVENRSLKKIVLRTFITQPFAFIELWKSFRESQKN